MSNILLQGRVEQIFRR